MGLITVSEERYTNLIKQSEKLDLIKKYIRSEEYPRKEIIFLIAGEEIEGESKCM